MYKNKMLIYGIALVENGKISNLVGHILDRSCAHR